MTEKSTTPMTYRAAGVDIDAGEALVDKIKPLAAKTMRPEVMASIGGFGAMFELPTHYKQPVLVSGTDGVGTKLRLAFDWDCHDTVGIDLVAMSVNDILVQGAEPLYFLDYFACGKLSVETAAAVVSGIAEGCLQSACALIGGETAEMPGMYPDGEYDLAGFAVGAVEKSKIIDGKSITQGDVILGLASSGAHSNGYSLLRKVIDHTGAKPDDEFNGKTLRDVAMAPTRIYVKSILSVLNKFDGAIKGMSHITGGGITENIPRILPSNLAAQIDRSSWEMPYLFQWIQKNGNVDSMEMLRVFNCGIGMAVIVPADKAQTIANEFIDLGETVYQIGSIINAENDQRVKYI